MGKAVLISIQPKWCELITSGKKTVEVRKTKPKLETPFKVYIYCTNVQGQAFFTKGENGNYNPPRFGNRKVIGEFVCDKIVKFENSMYEPAFGETSVLSCVKAEELALYLGNNEFGYGWHITDLVIYNKPLELSEFSLYCKGECTGCKYLEWVELYNSDACLRPRLKRPPQSWCYVEELP